MIPLCAFFFFSGLSAYTCSSIVCVPHIFFCIQQLTPEQQQQLAHEQQLLAAQQQQHEAYQQQLAAHQQQQLLHRQHLAAQQHQVHQQQMVRYLTKRNEDGPVFLDVGAGKATIPLFRVVLNCRFPG